MEFDIVTLINSFCYLVTTASVVVKFTPSTKDDALVAKLMQVVRVVSIAPKEDKAK